MTEMLNQKEMKVIIFQLMDKEYAIGVDIVQSIEKTAVDYTGSKNAVLC